MTCGRCGTEIADKAIVCYRCGAPTAAPAPTVRPGVGRRRSWPLLLVLGAALAALAWWFGHR